MGDLYFLSSIGERRLVKENIQKNQIVDEIRTYVHQLNPDYKIFYIRQWSREKGTITYDVGSWSEFFEFMEVNNEES